jgi:hypothetical protein
MTNESNSGPKGAPEDDPLSATAMFFRTLDQQAGGKQAEPAANFDFGAGPADGDQKTPPARPSSASDNGEFTAIFGHGSPAGTPAPPSPPKPVPSEDLPPSWQEQAPPANQGQGEFTRIFVKGAPTPSKPVAKISEPASEAVPPRAKGFSSPGISDAASAQASFSQFFKPISKADAAPAEPAKPPSPPAFRPGPSRANSTPDPFSMDSSFAPPAREPSTPAQDPQSITSLIQALSSQASAVAGARASETAPYRQESPAPFQPVAKPSAPSEFESGGVTQFIQRLAEMPPAPVAETPPVVPVREQDSGPGEYTRIIAAPTRPIANPPAAPAVSPAPAPSAPPLTPAFVRPVIPAMPAVPAIPTTPSVAAHAASYPSPMAAMQPPAIPVPHLPPVPAPPAVAAPKGKLEALVPMLLVVNTFLLVVILVVMIFLIKAR